MKVDFNKRKNMNYRIIPVTNFSQNCLLIWCNETKLAALVDPGGDADKIKKEVSNIKLKKIIKILLTHGHIDHVGAATELSNFYNIPIIGPEKEDAFWLQSLPIQSRMFGLKECCRLIPDRWLHEGDTIKIGNILLQVLHCPGHTPGHIVFFEKKEKFLISGDLIFKNGIGRSDFPRSNYTELVNSIEKKILLLGDDVIFLPGHGPVSVLGHERLYNPFLQKI